MRTFLSIEGFTNGRQGQNVIEQVAYKVNDLFEGIANTASDTFDQAIKPAPVKPVRQSVPACEFPVPTSIDLSVATKKPNDPQRISQKGSHQFFRKVKKCEQKYKRNGKPLAMNNTKISINFDAPAVLGKWASIRE
jgi:hypothetical protein